jgi:hypothetical protein
MQRHSLQPTEFLLRPTEFFFHWLRRGIATNRIFAVTNGICTGGGGGARYKQRARKWGCFLMCGG